MAGETGPIDVSRAIAMVMAGLFTLSVYNVLEISIAIFSTFRRRSGLYFWSMVIATVGILLHAISGFLRYFDLAPNFLMCVLICIGWYAMVTGQSVVLYSRLHLVTTHVRYSRWILYMIIFDFFALHVPTTILFLGSNHGVSKFVVPFNIYERVQLTGFSVQETIISGLYIWETMTGLRPLWAMKGRTGQRIITNIVLINVIAVLLDVSLLATEYTGNFDIQTTYKPVVYSVKLKMEFTVLNSLLAVVRTNSSAIEDIQSLRTDDLRLHIEPRWSGDRSDRSATATTAFGVDDQSHRRNTGKDSSTHTHHSWLSDSHRMESI
ncbi:hypothetical protein N7448_003235 [Penicillium atrosanguineum]|uniref:P-loop containing nucleoside triphosphate hydrolase protein n=1 Tax=Penicillium atrosanguineum TaxID=1132637 RepID=UPI002381FC73|nr:P-loop containing nucleoside triphosphate hydrolase protein [Penicillium atrosanguineum]KAJ5122105.1 hypothetical protein N7526_009042 [Penicillium atrosanguineum]KAJ5139827.1 hypothetical protein N7448_003235 [Penicillium atrosanguineum]KAJ5309747.1 P-loop containing nucleoside triphosphate hydrolase protein [Penicillium atrosanguineum]